MIIYADTRCLLFANTRIPAAANISRKLWEGQLFLESETARTMSQAAYILSQPGRWEADNMAALFKEAFAQEPRWLWSYMMLFTHTQGSEELFRNITALIEEQLVHLESIPLDNADAGMIMECRMYIAESLSNLAGYMNRPDIKEKRNQSQLAAKQLWSGITGKWKPLITN